MLCRENVCFPTKTAYMKVLYAALLHDPSDQSEATKQHRRHLEETLVTTALSYFSESNMRCSSSPGEAEFFETVAAKLLQCIVGNACVCKVSCQQLLVRLLSCQLYEVRLQTLLFLLQALAPTQGSGTWNDGNTQSESGHTEQSLEGQVTTDVQAAPHATGHVTNAGLQAVQDAHVFAKLVTMATGEESHPECLARVSIHSAFKTMVFVLSASSISYQNIDLGQ